MIQSRVASLILRAAVLSLALYAFLAPAALSAADSRIFEMRIYTANDGKLDALHARFRNGPKDEESYWGGLLDGRARIGYRFSSVSLGLAVGYGDAYNYRRSSLGRPYIGGLQLGIYADWR